MPLASGRLRLSLFERRYSAGSVLQISVWRRGTIGKYTRFAIRRGLAPGRQDACVSADGHMPVPCPTSGSGDGSRLLDPFPIVRVRGRLVPGGARISLLTVVAPAGVPVTVRCIGSSCPTPEQVQIAGAGPVSFTRFQRRFPAGTTLQIFVWQIGKIGKFTRITVRRAASPSRKDLCLSTDGHRTITCPGT